MAMQPLPVEPAPEPAPEELLEDRILILAPTGRDASLTCEILGRAGLDCRPCADEAELCAEIGRGAAVAILAEEALHPWTVNALQEALGRQGPWSDLPLIVFTRDQRNGEAVLEALGPLGNATILDRPVRVSTLVSAVQAALRARRRQYEVRDLLRRQADADRRKDEFLAMLGHELRNPLAAIRNALWVLEEIGAQTEPIVRQRQVIQRQTHHLVRMVDDLLDVSRVTRGKISLQNQTVSLEVLVDRCLTQLGLGHLADTHDLAVTAELDPVCVDGDPVRLEQVICNLLHNAVKYTPRGGAISVSLQREGSDAVVRVNDTGVGIAPDMLDKIFEPFTQVEDSRKRAAGGLGLGLPLVRSLILLHGGTVEAESQGLGRGSRFTVRLPAVSTPPAALFQSEDAGAAPPSGQDRTPEALRILVVEDNRDGRESLRDLLEIWGHEVHLAETGPDGIEAALTRQPDLALVDIGLPGLDGNEVAQQIRGALGDRLALVAMTGYGQPEDRRRALQAGFDAYLVKPVDPNDLARTLREACRRSAPPRLRMVRS